MFFYIKACKGFHVECLHMTMSVIKVVVVTHFLRMWWELGG